MEKLNVHTNIPFVNCKFSQPPYLSILGKESKTKDFGETMPSQE